MTVYESIRANIEGRECIKGPVPKNPPPMLMNQSTSKVMRSYPVCNYVIPVKLAFIFLVEAEEKSVNGQTPDPPARFDRAVLWVLGQFQHLHPCICVIAQAQESPQSQGQLIGYTASKKK